MVPSSDAGAGQSVDTVRTLVERARAAQRIADGYTQQRVDELVAAAGWAIMEPARNRLLAELAVADTGIGNVADKVRKNHDRTLGLLRDLQHARSVGVIAQDAALGIVEIARPVGVVCAVTPSANPAATPANHIINALKGRNAVIVAPSPKGLRTCARLIQFIHAQLDRIAAPRDLVQLLPQPSVKQATLELMRQCDLVVAGGSQANVRAAHASGTPAFGVGDGNVAAIVDETADYALAAERITLSKTFDNASSCASENSLVLVGAAREPMLAALQKRGAVLLSSAQKVQLQHLMWPDGKLSSVVVGQSAAAIASKAAVIDSRGAAMWKAMAARKPTMLLVEEHGFGDAHPFSGEKLSPVLTIYHASDFDAAAGIVQRLYDYQGAGHSVGLHSQDTERALRLGMTLPVARVIVNQPHCLAAGGGFDNGLPFSLSLGCGTWGGNIFSDNLHYRQYLNITRVSQPIGERVPSEQDIFGGYFGKYGKT